MKYHRLETVPGLPWLSQVSGWAPTMLDENMRLWKEEELWNAGASTFVSHLPF